MTESRTDHARCVFEVKDNADGTFWLMLNVAKPGLPIIENGFVGFELKKKLSKREADDLARLLNENIDEVSCTTFEPARRR